MSLLNRLRKNKQKVNNDELKIDDVATKILSDEEINSILNTGIENFFPESGKWYGNCFKRSRVIGYGNLPCHLRDNEWMSGLLKTELEDHEGVFIPLNKIIKFIDNSKKFENLRHEYELRIVKWQIDWIHRGGDGWIIPEEYGEFSMTFSEDVDKILRGGVVETLLAIGMNKEVIEEGLEKYADNWRHSSMVTGFYHLFDPYIYQSAKVNYEKPSEEHMKNWIADREYEYYKQHKISVDKYGVPTKNMLMSDEEHSRLVKNLKEQNKQRLNYIKDIKTTSIGDSFVKFYSEISKD